MFKIFLLSLTILAIKSSASHVVVSIYMKLRIMEKHIIEITLNLLFFAMKKEKLNLNLIEQRNLKVKHSILIQS